MVAQQISQIAGVAQVIIGGAQKPAVRVQIDPGKLQARGLTLEDVRSVLAVANTDASKGSINNAEQSFTITANDQLLQADEYNDVIIGYRNGAPIQVRDVGQAVAGPETSISRRWPATSRPSSCWCSSSRAPTSSTPSIRSRSRYGGWRPSYHQASGSTPSSTGRRPSAPPSTTSRLTLALTICMVVLVILLFLRNLWATLIPGITVPLALLGATAMMYLFGFSLDNLSLMALTLAVGSWWTMPSWWWRTSIATSKPAPRR